MLETPNSWQAIHDEVLRRIQTRRWRPGDLIPTEAELAEEFGCARATVSRALRELAEAGLLDRRRKAGTRIALNPVRRAQLEIPILHHEIEARGAVYGYALIASGMVDAPLQVRSQMQLRPETQLLHVRAVHLADGAPYVYEDRWVNAEAVPEILQVDLTCISANEWLVSNAPYSRGNMVLSAIPADRETAAVLQTHPNAALFLIERTTWNRDSPVTHVRQIHGVGHRLTMTL